MSAKAKKRSITQISRVVIQILFFILLPGLYASTFEGVKQVYMAVKEGSFSFTSYLSQIVGILALFPVTLLFGRFFCGWMCAFGSMGDFLYFVGSKFRKKPLQVPEAVDTSAKAIKYILLAALIGFFWNQSVIDLNGTNPWDAFGVLATVTQVPDLAYAWQNFAIGVVLLVLIMMGSVFIERFFCRYLCPLGAMFAIIARLRIFKIVKPSKDCGSCTLCTKKCAMGIPLYKNEKVSSGECINCMKCVSGCPRKNVHAEVTGQDIQPILVGTFAVAVMTGAYYTTTYASEKIGGQVAVVSSADSNATQGKYTDGTYQGSGTGFRNGTTTVSVTVESGVITNIETVSYEDDAPYYTRAFSTVVSEIISQQSTDVDAVSGATFSSNGIMSAVADALKTAGGDTTTSTDSSTESASNSTTTNSNSTTTDSSTSSSGQQNGFAGHGHGSDGGSGTYNKGTSEQSDSTSGSTSSSSATTNGTTGSSSSSNSTTSGSSSTSGSASTTYADGTYEGSGTGFRNGTTKVNVTVSGGKITDVEVVSYEDDAPYFTRASSTVISEIISQQSTTVDAVSGATFSSKGIMSAVADALEQAQSSAM